MDRVRLGIIGLGNMGSAHIKDNVPKVDRLELTAVCDNVPARLKPYSHLDQFEDSGELIRSGLVDAVLIATPHYDHTTIGIDAFENGLHVLVEKPISVHKADAQRLIDAYEAALKRNFKPQNAPVFGAMFNQRTDTRYQAIKNLIDSGELGEIRRINWIVTDWFRTAAYYASGGWRATWAGEGGGVLLNQCPHNLDLYQWLFGMPTRVNAFCGFGKFHDVEVEDSVTAFLEHPNGATGVFITTTGEAPGTNRLEIAADRGRVVFQDGNIVFNRTVKPVQEFSDTTPDLFPSLPTWKCEIPTHGYGGQHLEILRNFIDAILDRKPLIAPAPEGINSVELANAMIYSGLTGQRVDLPMDAAVYEAKLKELIAGSTRQKKVVEAQAGDMASSFR
jgi:predicted dehydrogenase